MVRKRNPEATKQQILNAAHEEFCERGFDGARVDSIAKNAEANKRLIYHYFGNKEDLYRAVLADAYRTIRQGERELSLEQYPPVEAMDRLVRFTFRHFYQNPWFLKLLTTENLHNARFLKTLPEIKDQHSPLVSQIREIIQRGAAEKIFRNDVDPIQLYISIAALGYFYLANAQTLSFIFDVDLLSLHNIQEREAHAVTMVLDYLRYKQPSQ
ncbi:TetR/AcrR family transcriptional regulator [Marinobacterium lutimaris]|uniref:Transcriptional regulator, TetR family n=1 Tax=Marinobacterium lutimaris TaxID=568106 RepID=A0A1H6B4D3_9GAMM|nr:TetR/AcrR family transcriptional regulator [Marinobacterium lutimaris]SEG55470.1 transcriptional regulator, TetR family [Marinobacterium lutimaris]